MGVSKMIDQAGLTDFTTDFEQSNVGSARNSIHSIRTVTTNADFADTESVAYFDPEAHKKKIKQKIPQLKNVVALSKQEDGENSARNKQQNKDSNPFNISNDAKGSMIGAGSARTSKTSDVKRDKA